jgi:hypothetical protein
MSDVVRFRSPRQPAHYVRAGRGFKFVGGRLAVSAADAGVIREYASSHPGLEIAEEQVRAARAPKAKAAEDAA